VKVNDLILDQCLEDIRAQRATVAECLARYPESADELKPLLETAGAIQAVPAVQPAAAFKQATRARLLRLQYSPTLGERLNGLFALGGSWRYAATAFVVVLLFAATSGGVAYAASGSLPGSAFYPVKRAVEQVQLNLATTSEDKARVYMEFADHRLNEALTLSERGQNQLAEQAVKEYDDDVNTAVTTVPYQNLSAAQSISNALNRQQQRLRAAQAPGAGKKAIQNALNASQKALEHLSSKPTMPAAPPPGPKPTSTRVPALPPTQPTATETPRAIERLRATETLIAPPLPLQPTLTTTIPTTVPTFIPPGQVPKLTVVPPGPGGSDQRGHEK